MSNQNGDHRSNEPAAEALTALALNQLHGDERVAAEAQLAASGEAAQREVRENQALAAALTAARNAEPLPQPSAGLRKAIEERLEKVELPARRRSGVKIAIALAAGSLLVVLCAVLISVNRSARLAAMRMQAGNRLKQIGIGVENHHDALTVLPFDASKAAPANADHDVLPSESQAHADAVLGASLDSGGIAQQKNELISEVKAAGKPGDPASQPIVQYAGSSQPTGGQGQPALGWRNDPPVGAVVAPVTVPQSVKITRFPSSARVSVSTNPTVGRAADFGTTQLGATRFYDTRVAADPKAGQSQRMVTPRIIVQEDEQQALGVELPSGAERVKVQLSDGKSVYVTAPREEGQVLAKLAKTLSGEELRVLVERVNHYRSEVPGTEQYDRIIESAFLSPRQQPLSTFSIDVDPASYTNVQRFLTGGRLPPADAVRIEELVNYFKYDYPQPKGAEPFSVNMEAAECPWQTGHLLLRVGLKGKEVARAQRPPSHLVFLLDVSGSMQDENKLPLLKTAMNMLVNELGENDRVSIVTYAGEAGLRLAPTGGHERAKISAAIDSLSAGGSTNGSAGINLAYEQSAAYFVKGGTNRVILCTDGDLNVGVTSDDALVQLIKEKAAGGTFLTVLGFGEGNLKDAKLEKLADNGNGQYAYINDFREARRVLVEQLTGSTITIAKDVKIQIEFNPHEIAAYRLLGYENRVLAAKDFANDNKDAGEIGAGHTVTALYELVPAGAVAQAAPPAAEPLKYQAAGDRGQESGAGGNALRGVPGSEGGSKLTDAAKSGELLTLKLRYKEPEASESKLLEFPLKDRGGSFHAASRDLQFAASVASFGMILRGSQHRGSGNLPAVLEIATTSLGDDAGGYRAEFIDLVRKAQALGAK